MKNISKDPIATHIFNANVVDWHYEKQFILFDDIIRIEEEIKLTYDPQLLFVFLSTPSPEQINLFIRVGFEFIQSRLSLEKTISSQHFNLYPFELVQVTDKNQLENLIQLCSGIEFDDRFSVDPVIKNEKALERNIYFLKESFKKKDEFIFLLVNNTQKTICGFRSFKIEKNQTAYMLLSGITRNDKIFDYTGLISYLELKALENMNIKKVKSVVFMNNFEEINQYIAELGYRVYNTTTVLRKMY